MTTPTGQIATPPAPKLGVVQRSSRNRPPAPQGELRTGQAKLEPGQIAIRKAAVARMVA